MRVFERIIESSGEPGKGDLWVKPVEGGYEIRIWGNGKWSAVSESSGGGGEGEGSKVVRLVGNSDESAWLGSLADLVEAVASGDYEGGIYVNKPDSFDGVRYSPIVGCEYLVSDGDDRVRFQTSAYDGTVYTDFAYDSPDVLRWLSAVGEEMCEAADGYFVRGERIVEFGQMPGGTAMSVNFTNDNHDSISLYVCDGDRHPYRFDITDGVITGVGLFDIVAPEEVSVICLSQDKVSPLVGKSTTISGGGSNPDGK